MWPCPSSKGAGDELLRLPAVPAAAPLPAPPGWPCHHLLCFHLLCAEEHHCLAQLLLIPLLRGRQPTHCLGFPGKDGLFISATEVKLSLRHEWLWVSWDFPLGTASTWTMCLSSSSEKRIFLYKNTPNSFSPHLYPERDMVTTNECLCSLHPREICKSQLSSTSQAFWGHAQHGIEEGGVSQPSCSKVSEKSHVGSGQLCMYYTGQVKPKAPL